MSGSPEAGTPQPESGAPADASLLTEGPARAPEGAVSDTIPPAATPSNGVEVDVVPSDPVAPDGVVTAAAAEASTTPGEGAHAERDLVLSTGARIVALASVILGA